MRVTSNTGATVLAHEGTEYTADETGAFDLPTDLGARLIRFPDWDEEYVALDRTEAARVAAEREPDAQTARITALEERVQALEELLLAEPEVVDIVPPEPTKASKGKDASETPPAA